MSSESHNSPTRVSVIIPVRNEEKVVGDAIRSALDQVGAPPFEVVVADGDSTDGTRSVVAAMSHDDPRVRLVSNAAGNTPAGLNSAIQQAAGSVIVRCDAHSCLPPNYVATALEILEDTDADVVGGVQRAVGKGFWQRAAAIAMTTPVGVGDARFHLGGAPGPVDTVYLGVFRRSALARVGLFDESLARNQDYEMNLRIRNSGGEVYFHPGLSVDYAPRASLKSLAKQYYQYGMWKRVVVRRFPDSLRWRQLAAPLLVVGLVVSAVLALFGLDLLALVIPGAYTLAVAATTIVELLRRRSLAALGLPFVLPTMHFSWALGFMTGDLDDRGPLVPPLDPQ